MPGQGQGAGSRKARWTEAPQPGEGIPLDWFQNLPRTPPPGAPTCPRAEGGQQQGSCPCQQACGAGFLPEGSQENGGIGKVRLRGKGACVGSKWGQGRDRRGGGERVETLRGEGGGEAQCRPCQGLLPALLPGSGNRLKENRKGEKESKQTQRKAWSSERWGCLVWRSHLLGHSQPFCRQTPTTPATQGVCTLTHKHTYTQIQIYRHIDTHIHRHVCVYRHTHTHSHAYIQTQSHTHIHKHTHEAHRPMHRYRAQRSEGEGGCWGQRVSIASSSLTTSLLSPHNTHSSAPRCNYSNTSHALSLSSKLLTWINLFKPHSHSTRRAL